MHTLLNVFLYENNEIARLKIKAFVISDTNQMVIGEPTFLTFNNKLYIFSEQFSTTTFNTLPLK